MGKMKWRVQEWLLLQRVQTSPEFVSLNRDASTWVGSATKLFTSRYVQELSYQLPVESDADFALRHQMQKRAKGLVPFGEETQVEMQYRLAHIAEVCVPRTGDLWLMHCPLA